MSINLLIKYVTLTQQPPGQGYLPFILGSSAYKSVCLLSFHAGFGGLGTSTFVGLRFVPLFDWLSAVGLVFRGT